MIWFYMLPVYFVLRRINSQMYYSMNKLRLDSDTCHNVVLFNVTNLYVGL